MPSRRLWARIWSFASCIQCLVSAVSALVSRESRESQGAKKHVQARLLVKRSPSLLSVSLSLVLVLVSLSGYGLFLGMVCVQSSG